MSGLDRQAWQNGTQKMEIRKVEERRLMMAKVNLSQTIGERGLLRTFSFN